MVKSYYFQLKFKMNPELAGLSLWSQDQNHHSSQPNCFQEWGAWELLMPACLLGTLKSMSMCAQQGATCACGPHGGQSESLSVHLWRKLFCQG